ncbi:hypothetical protein [Vibrio sp. D431a]|uniref:hypothetical protein n=1 Tax=Vibrio sp. D431a TaxID=2837388 RepID=UPI0025551239|nr:hypothetical protein [Vibrio sp. D431a]MDK9793259.1 hypothetical protein [Vibrio sp. D431a]
MSRTHSISPEHLRYLRDDFGLRGFLRDYPQSKSLSFLRWLNSELKKADSQKLDAVVVEFPSVHLDIAAHGLSIVAFRIVTQTIGRDNADDIKQIIEHLKNAQYSLNNESEKGAELAEFFKQTTDEFRKLLSSNIRDIYNEVLEYGNNKAKWPIPIQPIRPSMDFHFQKGSGVSWAKGDKQIRFSLDPFVRGFESGEFFYREYKSFCKDRYIGEFSTKNWKLPIYAIICHEVAHAFQFRLEREAIIKGRSDVAADMAKAHGQGWRDVYRILRDKFVNGVLYEGEESEKDEENGSFGMGGRGGSGGISLKEKKPPQVSGN